LPIYVPAAAPALAHLSRQKNLFFELMLKTDYPPATIAQGISLIKTSVIIMTESKEDGRMRSQGSLIACTFVFLCLTAGYAAALCHMKPPHYDTALWWVELAGAMLMGVCGATLTLKCLRYDLRRNAPG
jgi:hypothetical protein